MTRAPDATSSPVLLLPSEATTVWERAYEPRIGELAMQAKPVLSEEKFIESFRRTLGTDRWPDVDFRATAACCATGERKAWSAADGIELSRAVASSSNSHINTARQ